MSVRQDIEVILADPPRVREVHNYLVITSKGKLKLKQQIIGFKVYETIGVGAINPKIMSVKKVI